ncbi:MAG: hypothetical protein AAF236_02460 [Verrucomicrobiota bacterium]
MDEDPPTGDAADPRSDANIEAELQRIRPLPLNVEFLEELARDAARIESVERHSPTRPQWSRVIPLTLAACLAMAVFAHLQYGSSLSSPDPVTVAAGETQGEEISSGGTTTSATQPATVVAEPIPRARVSSGSLVPVSSQGFLLDANRSGRVETGDGVSEEMTLQFEDAWHWHDPETKTNVRFFSPREEQILVPLPTD